MTDVGINPLAPGPNVTAVNPASGSTLGNDGVTISGNRLTGATAVMFGSVPALDFIVESDVSITATSAPQAAGAVGVTVTTPGGTSGPVTFTYTVDAPTAGLPQFLFKTVVINAGESLSEAVDCSQGTPTFIYVPDNWTSARLSFQVSPEGTDFYDLFDVEAHEITVNVVAGTAVRIDPKWTTVTYLKIRSGVRSAPKAQENDCSIVIAIDTA